MYDVYLCGCCVWMYLHLCAVLWMCVSVYWTPINKDKLHLLSSLISPPHPSLSSAAAPLAAHKLPTAQKLERSLHELYSKLLIIMSISNHWNTSWSFAWSNFQPLKIKVWISILLSTVECRLRSDIIIVGMRGSCMVAWRDEEACPPPRG